MGRGQALSKVARRKMQYCNIPQLSWYPDYDHDDADQVDHPDKDEAGHDDNLRQENNMLKHFVNVSR